MKQRIQLLTRSGMDSNVPFELGSCSKSTFALTFFICLTRTPSPVTHESILSIGLEGVDVCLCDMIVKPTLVLELLVTESVPIDLPLACMHTVFLRLAAGKIQSG